MATTRTQMCTFTVTGTGMFPFDMLRYDRCTPATESDSEVIERSTRRALHANDRPTRRVTLVGPRAPTTARWQSFGWSVEEAA